MDSDLKQKFAPLRGNRRAHSLRSRQEPYQVGLLEWKTNDYEFQLLCDAVFGWLESEYGDRGIRLGQLVSREDLMIEARRLTEAYKRGNFEGWLSLHVYLLTNLAVWLGGKGQSILDQRRAHL